MKTKTEKRQQVLLTIDLLLPPDRINESQIEADFHAFIHEKYGPMTAPSVRAKLGQFTCKVEVPRGD